MTYRAPFRLAFRQEGDVVNCYFANAKDMTGAVLLASISVGFVQQMPNGFDCWKTLLADLLRAQVARAVGGKVEIEMIEQLAAEHEKSGRA
jgi:hypothetical protein